MGILGPKQVTVALEEDTLSCVSSVQIQNYVSDATPGGRDSPQIPHNPLNPLWTIRGEENPGW